MKRGSLLPQGTNNKGVVVGSGGEGGVVAELYEIYEALNKELWENQLPPCDISILRHRRSYGSVAFNVDSGGTVIPHIYVNSGYLFLRTIRSTMAMFTALMCEIDFFLRSHKLCHYRTGRTVRMLGLLGLISSSNGQPSGRGVGRHKGVYIVHGGAFDRSFAQLMQQKRTWITWNDGYPFGAPPNGFDCIDVRTFDANDREVSYDADLDQEARKLRIPPAITGQSERRICPPIGARHPRAKRLYMCPKCNTRVWGKPGLQGRIGCGDCKLEFEQVD